MNSLYLNRLPPEARQSLIDRLYSMQSGNCFICERPIDLNLHANSVDIDHVEPLKLGGRDGEENFALTHSTCNRSKQATDLRVARVLARFEQIRERCSQDNRGPNLADILQVYGGAKYELMFDIADNDIRLTLDAVGDPEIQTLN